MTLKQRVAQLKKLFAAEDEFPCVVGGSIASFKASAGPPPRRRKRARRPASRAAR
jgi:hypothetical protein